MEKVVERFLRYVNFNTRSDEKSASCPSTTFQLELARDLVRELKGIGIYDADVDENGYVMATLPANVSPGTSPVIGFIAHLDTSPEFSGKDIKPQIVRNYRGGDIVLNRDQQILLKESEFPELKKYIGQDLITTDGTTLLGADDKAGIAEIMTALAYLQRHPEIPHGTVRVAFTPDEEIGRGADRFDVKKFGADFAYTVDGGELGQLETENFNAASAVFTIKGKNIHPGSAKNKMINSILIAREIMDFFPPGEIPAKTEGYQGFFHVNEITGTVEETVIKYIIRDHDARQFERRKQMAISCREKINKRYKSDLVSLDLKDSYRNMKEVLAKHPHVKELALRAMRELQITPLLTPIRGGTDGARLSFMGLPTPNLFTGGHNFHGKYEFIPIPSMLKAVQTIVNICKLGSTCFTG